MRANMNAEIRRVAAALKTIGGLFVGAGAE